MTCDINFKISHHSGYNVNDYEVAINILIIISMITQVMIVNNFQPINYMALLIL